MKKYTIVQKSSRILVGIACRTSNAPEAAPHDIPKLWAKFYSENILDQIPNKLSNEVLALYCDYEGDYTQPYSLVIGCPVQFIDTLPDGMVSKFIPEGSYAAFSAVGDYPKSLIETWGEIWQQKDLKRTYTGDYEVYGDKFTSGFPQQVDVFIAVQQEPLEEISKKNRPKFAAIKSLNLPIGQYAITGSGTLGIRNLRPINDIDIIVTKDLWNLLEKNYGITDEQHIKKIVFPGGIVEAFSEDSFYTTPKEPNAPTINDRIANAEIIDELPFEALDHVLYYKRKMGRTKDIQDIAMIEALQKNQ